ncbi:MAG: hypothetical protein ACI9HK_005366, partial [Pirellulaceae bacterium]
HHNGKPVETVNTKLNLTNRDSNLLALSRFAITFHFSRRGFLLVESFAAQSNRFVYGGVVKTFRQRIKGHKTRRFRHLLGRELPTVTRLCQTRSLASFKQSS